MNDRRFAEPVTILVGLGFPFQVNSVLDALDILSDWPGGRNPSQAAALNACRAALAGELDEETARGVFEAFARRTGILMPDVSYVGSRVPAQRQPLHGDG